MLDIPANYDYEAFYNGNAIQKWWKRRIANIIWEWIPDSEMLRLVDLGCGSSPIISKYGHLGSQAPVGLDRDAAKLEYATHKFPWINFVFADAMRTGFMDQSFNVVLAVEIIEHIEYPEDLIKEAARICEVGGKVVIATPDYTSPIWMVAENLYGLFKRGQYCDDHISHSDYQFVERTARREGLRVLDYKKVAKADMIILLERFG